jgi:hypothetical protein
MGTKTNLYYVVHIQLEDIDGFREATGWKTVSLYDIDIQSISLVEVYNAECELSCVSLNEIEEWMGNHRDWCFNNYNFIEL